MRTRLKRDLWVQIVKARWQFTAKQKYRNMEADIFQQLAADRTHLFPCASYHAPSQLFKQRSVFTFSRDQNYTAPLKNRGLVPCCINTYISRTWHDVLRVCVRECVCARVWWKSRSNITTLNTGFGLCLTTLQVFQGNFSELESNFHIWYQQTIRHFTLSNP
jgi:hypothetical protein